ncbi:MAG: DUF4058 family protein [Caldilineaceae bacterium]
MPSPFPGMDPYLEGSEWTSFHFELCGEICHQLRPKLRPRYMARAIKRFVTDMPDDLVITTESDTKSSNIYPDVGIAQVSSYPLREPTTRVAVLEPPLEMATVMPERIPQYAVEIRDIEEHGLVTLIEVLSPANKYGVGYKEYLAKRQRILLSTAHLLEIDLLRKGQRVPMRQPLPQAPYFVFLSRYEKRPISDVWPMALDHPLPIIPVPLLPGDKDVTLDLQLALNTIYDSVGYDLVFNYTKPPDIPLDEKAAQWAATLLENRPNPL